MLEDLILLQVFVFWMKNFVSRIIVYIFKFERINAVLIGIVCLSLYQTEFDIIFLTWGIFMLVSLEYGLDSSNIRKKARRF